MSLKAVTKAPATAPAHGSHRLTVARDFDISERMYALIMRKSERASEREGGESEGMCVYEIDNERVGGVGGWGGREGGWVGGRERGET